MAEPEALSDFERVAHALRAAGASDRLNMDVAFAREHRDLHAYLCALSDVELAVAVLLVVTGQALDEIRSTVRAVLAHD